MASWGEFAAAEPEVAAAGKKLFENALLATYDFRCQWPPSYERWRAKQET